MEPNSLAESVPSKTSGRPRGPGTSHRFAYLVVGLLIVSFAAWLIGKPFSSVYRSFKATHAVELVHRASQMADQGKWAEADQLMGTATGLAPADPEVLRVSSRLCARTGNPDGLVRLQALLRTKSADLKDRIDYINMALDFNRVDISGPELARIFKTNRTDPTFLKLMVRHLRASGRPENARIAAREWLSNQSTNSEAEFALGELLTGSPSQAEREEGNRLLLTLAVGSGPQRDEAVDALAHVQDLPRAETQLLLKALAKRTNSQVAMANLKLRLEPDVRPQIVEEIVGLVKGTTNSAEIIRYVSWLRENGEVTRIPDLLPEERVLNKPELLTARLEALILSGRVNEVMLYLTMKEPPVEPYLQHCLNALADEKQGKGYLVRNHFNSALAAAGDSVPKIRAIAAYAENMKQPMAAVAAYQKLMQYPTLTVQAGRNIMRLVGPLDDMFTIHDTLKRLSNFMPQDDSLYLGFAYSSFLIGESSPEMRKVLANRAKKAPQEKLYPFVIALGLHKAGNPTEALAMIESVATDWDTEEPRWSAVYVAILGANQQREAARVMAAKIDTSKLKGPELELIKPWLPQ